MTKGKTFLFYGILTVFVLVATGVLVEIVARIMLNDKQFTVHGDEEVFTYDEVLGWKGIPGYRGVPRPEYGAKVGINSLGFRDTDWASKVERADREGLLKILFLGDSTLYGARINARERISEQLADIYRSKGREVAVFNSGIPGFGTDQQLRVYEKYESLIRPDIIILRFTENDVGDSALPYNQRYSLRVYKPFYNYEGKLVLNEFVPRRFSYAVRDTILGRLRSRFLVDQVQILFDSFRYAEFELPQNTVRRTRNPVIKNWFEIDDRFGFDSMFELYQYRDLYNKNVRRTVALMKRMKDKAESAGALFKVLIDMSTSEDGGYSEKDFQLRLRKEGIDIVNSRAYLTGYGPWSYVNYDGHPNFLDNYAGALALYNQITDSSMEFRPGEASWYEEVPHTIDFSNGDYGRFLFGHWHPHGNEDPGAKRWMGDSARVMLANPGGMVKIEVSGEADFRGENTSVYSLGNGEWNYLTILENGQIIDRVPVPDKGEFDFSIEHESENDLLLLHLVSSRSFRRDVAGVSKDGRQLSVLVSKIGVEKLQ